MLGRECIPFSPNPLPTHLPSSSFVYNEFTYPLAEFSCFYPFNRPDYSTIWFRFGRRWNFILEILSRKQRILAKVSHVYL